MADITEFNNNFQTTETTTLIDEVSATEYYIGVSDNGKFTNKAVWRIKKIKKTGNVWDVTLFPNGNQSYEFVWNDRTSYTYI